MIRTAAVTTTLLFWTALASAQAPVVSRIDVEVTNIDVVVTDRKGQPITGLTEADFEVLENSRRQEITNFSEVQRGVYTAVSGANGETPAASGAPTSVREEPRYVVIYVDQIGLGPGAKRLRPHIDTFLDALRPEDKAMVIGRSPAVNVRTQFTGDRAELKAAVDEAMKSIATGVRRRLQNDLARREMQLIQQEPGDPESKRARILFTARAQAASEARDVGLSLAAFEEFVGSMAGIEGRKVLLLVSENLTTRPGYQAFTYADSLIGGTEGTLASAEYHTGPVIQRIAVSANQADVVVYPVDAGGLDNNLNVSESTIGNSPGVTDLNVVMALSSSSRDGGNILAAETGGVATAGTNNFGRALDAIQTDLANYYSIGYRPQEGGAAGRKLEVRVNRPGAVVRYRKSFAVTTDEEIAAARVLAAVTGAETTNDLGISISVGEFAPAGRGKLKTSVDVKIPLATLALLPSGPEEHAGTFAVMVSAIDSRGQSAPVQEQTYTLRVPNADVPTLAGKHFTYTVELSFPKNTESLSIGVMDRATAMTGYATYEVPGTK